MGARVSLKTESRHRRRTDLAPLRTEAMERLVFKGAQSIMRLPPVPIRYSYMFPDEIGDLVERAIESSVPTHASPQCLSACVYLTVVLCGLIDGRPREEVLYHEWEPGLR